MAGLDDNTTLAGWWLGAFRWRLKELHVASHLGCRLLSDPSNLSAEWGRMFMGGERLRCAGLRRPHLDEYYGTLRGILSIFSRRKLRPVRTTIVGSCCLIIPGKGVHTYLTYTAGCCFYVSWLRTCFDLVYACNRCDIVLVELLSLPRRTSIRVRNIPAATINNERSRSIPAATIAMEGSTRWMLGNKSNPSLLIVLQQLLLLR